ncbi:hypothetical protein MLD38_037217 [Melastoma candidum]|uniref:Uncharacterized protein n=1 Tax=Melastoma candidum TaxID=119954 RepID=A0ACB9LLF5_9MYRT|nr:hypothetical protein MLD38_037217 [Melastoma candidum]
MQMTRSWDFLGVPDLHAPSSGLNQSNLGDGVIVGILDTGIWPESRSFNDEVLGPVPTRCRGSCDWGSESGSSKFCNKKIIGSRWYINGLLAEFGPPSNTSEFFSPRDAVGHGTHTVSTAAGSVASSVTFEGVGAGNARGGATLARLAIYKVCWKMFDDGVCTTVDILKAFDDAIHDGVHVLSLSIGPGQDVFDNEELDGIAVGSLHAVMEGITVVCAAGNSGPSPQSATNTAPWIITVAASTMDRAFQAPITLGNNETVWPIGFESLTFMPDFLAYENDSTSDRGCDAEKFLMIAGKVVFSSINPTPCNLISAILVGKKVKSCHGLGVIVTKDPEDDVNILFHDFPLIHVDYEIGTRILHYILSEKSPTVKLSPSWTLISKSITPRVALFSSSGPNYVAPAILKPDITAPGVNILAAVPSIYDKADNGPLPYPLLAAASPQKRGEPFDMGGGVVDPRVAAEPGLIYNMSLTDYIQYVCLENVTTVRRTVTNVGHPKSVNQVEVKPPLGTAVMVRPGVLVFGLGISKQSFEVEVTATAMEKTYAGYYFGSMTWRDGLHSVRIPIAVRMVTRSLFPTPP